MHGMYDNKVILQPINKGWLVILPPIDMVRKQMRMQAQEMVGEFKKDEYLPKEEKEATIEDILEEIKDNNIYYFSDFEGVLSFLADKILS